VREGARGLPQAVDQVRHEHHVESTKVAPRVHRVAGLEANAFAVNITGDIRPHGCPEIASSGALVLIANRSPRADSPIDKAFGKVNTEYLSAMSGELEVERPHSAAEVQGSGAGRKATRH
jgi:hypothetical protein